MKFAQLRRLIREHPAFAGARSGLIAAAAMYAFFLAIRIATGVATPSEMFADVSAPYIPVPLFGLLISVAGGYTPLKIIGFTSVLVGALVAGAAGGVLGARNANHPGRLVWPFAAALLALSLVLFWPVLNTNYFGLPPLQARFATIGTLAAGYALYAALTTLLLRRRGVTFDPSRSRFVAGSVAGAAALVGIGSWADLFAHAAFPYDGQMVRGPGVTPITPNGRFYAVTKNITDPTVDRDRWRLTLGGSVAQPMTFDFAQLTALPSVMQETTLMCINNDVDGGLMSNARWQGVQLASLIEMARASSGVRRVAFHSADNYIETIPIAKALEPTTLIAYAMNGDPLPARHGFPARVLVPGYFGEKNPKWVVGISLETTELRGFYERQGWGPNFIVPTHARFDVPDFSQPLRSGRIAIHGVAFAGNRGVRRVEVSTDGGGSWNEATFSSPYVPTAWRLWTFAWDAKHAGTYRLLVRATDGSGALQEAMRRPTAPQGATGLDEVLAHVV